MRSRIDLQDAERTNRQRDKQHRPVDFAKETVTAERDWNQWDLNPGTGRATPGLLTAAERFCEGPACFCLAFLS